MRVAMGISYPIVKLRLLKVLILNLLHLNVS